ncbi:hypothetical protein QTP88_011516 [Uroleucon formosanum]
MELKNVVENWFNSQAASFYAEGLRKLVKRYEKCLEVNVLIKTKLSKRYINKKLASDQNQHLVHTLNDLFL